MFISNARRFIIGPQVIEGGPDLVIEILSPSNTRRDLKEKLRDYQSIDVREAWVAATQGQTVEVLQLSSERIERSGLYGLGDRIVSQVLCELQLIVDEVFPEM
jgi:Uma2 family endonuclease